ncbi:hypothetical protein [Myxococcus sp. SDU36]|uniref:hypothetical protein n=1 Tax=Myxococcus sp. SDU36 TaxID=2831967 RepID=UPI002543ABD6|nr:hypothetical protein [Myxococcus sp. SDU36]WIG94754.1 hypothetical protein KGD87_30235 [Myxococcus sp. SDU36]
MRSLNPVFSSAVVMALCSLLAGGCGGSPSDGESPDMHAPQSGGLGGKAGDEPTYPGDDGDDDATPGKVTICHIPPGNPANAHTLSVSTAAWPAHARHGDTLGPCDAGTGGEEPDAGTGEEPDAGGGEEPDAGTGGEDPDAGAPVCAPIGEACGESAACCFGLTCGEDNTCDPIIG